MLLVPIVPQRKPAAFTAKTLLVQCARRASLRPPVAVACCLFWHESKHGPGARSRRRYHRHGDDMGPCLGEHLTLIHWRDARRR